MARGRWIGVLGLGVGLAVSGCGSSSKTTSTAAPASAAPAAAAGTTLKLEADADGGLYFKPKKLTSKAGTVTLTMSDPSSSGLAHGIGVEGNGVDKDGSIVQAGRTSTITVTLKPGKYEFYCPIASHKRAGMKGTLVVS